MAIRGKALTVTFAMYDTASNAFKTGDTANITVTLVKDGGAPTAATNSPTEEQSGRYSILLTATEMTANYVEIIPTSATANIIGVKQGLTTDRGLISGPGATLGTITVQDGGAAPIADVTLWITSDEAGTNIVVSGLTSDDNGEATAYLDDGVTYYVFAKKSGTNFTNPATWAFVAGTPTLTVTGGAAAASAILSLSDAKVYLGVTGSDNDTVIAAMISAAQKAMEAHVRRHLVSLSVTELVDGTGVCHIWLREPAESITSMNVDSSRGFASGTEVTAANYQINESHEGTGYEVEYYDNVWSVGQKNVEAIYLAGFETIPEDIGDAAKLQIARMYAEWIRASGEGGNPGGVNILNSESVGGWFRQYMKQAGLDVPVIERLEPYMNTRL